MTEELYIGLMSGTSLDGIDAILVDFSQEECRDIAFYFQPFPASLKEQIRKLCITDHPILLTEYGAMDCHIGKLFADTVAILLKNADISARRVKAIGSHGLTLCHAPQNTHAFSLQIGDPNIIAENTGITTVSDFRRRDIAAGGQGAPLVPAFHQYFFGQRGEKTCIINIGGIANITLLNNHTAIGFDTGPGNTLIDYWIRKQLKQSYDKNGKWASGGSIYQPLLQLLKKDRYFLQPPPKSTGTEYFSGKWLEDKLNQFPGLHIQDIQTTLCQLTADTITDAILQFEKKTTTTLVCGGGCHNQYLVSLISENLQHPVSSTADYQMDPDHVEAAAFAWLARQTIQHRPGNLYKATGAKSPVILGGIYVGRQYEELR